MIEWQPIETAARDDVEIILYDPNNNPKVFTGFYIYSWCASAEGRSAPEDDFFGDSDKAPTHWMPLPEPPK